MERGQGEGNVCIPKTDFVLREAGQAVTMTAWDLELKKNNSATS